MPSRSKWPDALHVLSRGIWVIGCTLSTMVRSMASTLNQLQVANVVIALIVVKMVNLKAVRNSAAMKLPDIAVHVASAATIGPVVAIWLPVILAPVELLNPVLCWTAHVASS